MTSTFLLRTEYCVNQRDQPLDFFPATRSPRAPAVILNLRISNSGMACLQSIYERTVRF